MAGSMFNDNKLPQILGVDATELSHDNEYRYQIYLLEVIKNELCWNSSGFEQTVWMFSRSNNWLESVDVENFYGNITENEQRNINESLAGVYSPNKT